jgi:hypothetical protein
LRPQRSGTICNECNAWRCRQLGTIPNPKRRRNLRTTPTTFGWYDNANREGKSANATMQNSPYAPGINAFNAVLKGWRDAGELAGMALS